MKTSILAAAAGLSDRDLLARLGVLAGREREACVELVAHLAALDSRPAVFASEGYGSLFSYCTQSLRLSEDAACNRIEAARACRRFPVILDLLASGEVTLSAVRLLGRHLTPANHEAVLAKARRRSRQQIEVLVAELAPRPDVPTSVRKVPVFIEARAPATAAQAVGEMSSEPTPAVDRAAAAFPQTDNSVRKTDRFSRHVPRNVKRAVWRRDGGQCAYVASSGRRCSERTYLEFHHIQAHAHQGPPTVGNIALRCRRHNQYEAELIFGPRRPPLPPGTASKAAAAARAPAPPSPFSSSS